MQNINDPQSSAKFQEIVAAYETLSDSDLRAIYDEGGLEGLEHGGGGPNMEDVFNVFSAFGFGMGGMGRQRTKGEDSVIPYDVTLEDLYNGKSVKMNMEKEVICSGCQGTGGKSNAKPKTCGSCQGQGWVFSQRMTSAYQGTTTRRKCNDCHGQGERFKDKEKCKRCKGERTVKEKTRQEIFVEKGMSNGQRIVLTGAGDQEPGIPAGDVVFVLKVATHESFERIGNNLLTRVKITLSEALLGFSRILVTHLDGRGVKLTTPAGHIIKPNSSIIIRGEGMPVYKHPDQKGDLFVVFQLEMPDDGWLGNVDQAALAALLPPKKPDIIPQPAIVDEAGFEESDVVDETFHAQRSFEPGFGSGLDDEGDWEDEDDEDDYDFGGPHGYGGPEPECRPQ